MGLDEAITVRESPDEFVEAVVSLTNKGGVDVILDLVGGAHFSANLRALASSGRVVCVGITAGTKTDVDLYLILRKRATIIGTVLRARSIAESGDTVVRAACASTGPAGKGSSGDRVSLSAAKVRPAHEDLESNETFGKIVLEFT